jgi:hypothetical protein
MFHLYRVYNGEDISVPMLYVDDLQTVTSFANLKLYADHALDTLDILGVNHISNFGGYGFPLDGADFLTAITGTLTIKILSDLAYGLHQFPCCSTSSVPPLLGYGAGALGGQLTWPIRMNTMITVQHLTIPGTASTSGYIPIARVTG